MLRLVGTVEDVTVRRELEREHGSPTRSSRRSCRTGSRSSSGSASPRDTCRPRRDRRRAVTGTTSWSSPAGDRAGDRRRGGPRVGGGQRDGTGAHGGAGVQPRRSSARGGRGPRARPDPVAVRGRADGNDAVRRRGPDDVGGDHRERGPSAAARPGPGDGGVSFLEGPVASRRPELEPPEDRSPGSVPARCSSCSRTASSTVATCPWRRDWTGSARWRRSSRAGPGPRGGVRLAAPVARAGERVGRRRGARRPARSRGDRLSLRIPADPSKLASIRRNVTRWLMGHDVPPDAAADIVLASSERARTRSSTPTARRGSVGLDAAIDDGIITVVVTDAGRWRESRSRGRGRGCR